MLERSLQGAGGDVRASHDACTSVPAVLKQCDRLQRSYIARRRSLVRFACNADNHCILGAMANKCRYGLEAILPDILTGVVSALRAHESELFHEDQISVDRRGFGWRTLCVNGGYGY